MPWSPAPWRGSGRGPPRLRAAVGFPFDVSTWFFVQRHRGRSISTALVVTLFFGWVTGRRALTMLSALVVMGHIVATTSIKTNLGVLIGVVTALVFYFRRTMREVWRSAICRRFRSGNA